MAPLSALNIRLTIVKMKQWRLLQGVYAMMQPELGQTYWTVRARPASRHAELSRALMEKRERQKLSLQSAKKTASKLQLPKKLHSCVNCKRRPYFVSARIGKGI